MANVKISELPSLGLTGLTNNDVLPIVDINTSTTSKVTMTDLKDFFTSGITNYIEVTYDELVSGITASTLTAGNFYLITDFQTCYDQPDYDYNGNAIVNGIYRDDTEIQPILVFSTSSNTISDIAYQPSYPNDKIRYDWTFNTTEKTSGVTYGRITERIDEFNNRTDYDHRQIKFKRYRYYELSLNNPYQGTVEVIYISGTVMTVSGTGTNFLSSISVGNKIGFEPNNNDYRVYDVTSVDSDSGMTITGLTTVSLSPNTKMYSADWDEYSSYYQNNVDDPSVFEEYYTFDGIDNFNNYIGNHANLYNWQGNEFILANNVFHTRFIGNKFGDNCYNNTFFDDCENNNVGNFFYNNITDDDFDGNVIGNEFYNNKITANFQYNRIGESFYNNYIVQNSFYRNNIMNDFRDNEISGGDFQNNEIGNQFNNNKIKEQFYKNNIGNGFNQNNIYWGSYGNLIGNGFNQNDIYCGFYDNVIGENFYDNTLGDILSPSSREFYENKIGVRFQANTITNNFYRNDIGPGFYSNSLSGLTYANIIGEQFENNTIYVNFHDNQILNDFRNNNIYHTFSNNNIGNLFNNWTIGAEGTLNTYNFHYNNIDSGTNNNILLSNFFSNTIGNSFNSNSISGQCENNLIKYACYGNLFYGSVSNNLIGGEFTDNSIGNNFNNNNIQRGFSLSTVGNDFRLNNINTFIYSTDFTFANRVYGFYNCELFTNSSGTQRLSYFDGSDTLIVTGITS
jgi:hypothetical protein